MNPTTELYQSPKKEQNNERYGEHGLECVCCGRPMAAGIVKWVTMNTDWRAVRADIPEDDFEKVTGAPSQGMFPIGNECAKKMAGYTVEAPLEESHPRIIKKS